MKEAIPYLMHIRDALQNIQDYTVEGETEFFSDKKTQDAVVRNLEIVGEATKNLPVEFKESHPDCPWKQMAGMRDKVIHEYFGVNLQIVWDTVKNRVAQLLLNIVSLIEQSKEK